MPPEPRRTGNYVLGNLERTQSTMAQRLNRVEGFRNKAYTGSGRNPSDGGLTPRIRAPAAARSTSTSRSQPRATLSHRRVAARGHGPREGQLAPARPRDRKPYRSRRHPPR